MGLLNRLDALKQVDLSPLIDQVAALQSAVESAEAANQKLLANYQALREAGQASGLPTDLAFAAQNNPFATYGAGLPAAIGREYQAIQRILEIAQSAGGQQGQDYLQEQIKLKEEVLQQQIDTVTALQKQYDELVKRGYSQSAIQETNPFLISGLSGAKEDVARTERMIELLQRNDPDVLAKKISDAYVAAQKDGIFTQNELNGIAALTNELKALREYFPTQDGSSVLKTYEIKLSTGQSIRSTTDPTDFLAALEAAQRSAR